jgi:cytochrome c peroxidase
MAIAVGEKLPEATFVRMGEGGPEEIKLSDLTKGRKVVLFGLPGAYTGTCTSAHVPSFIRTKGQFDGKGVDEVVCVSVNDPFVMKAWGASTGATGAGLSMLADAGGDYTKAVGMDFTNPAVGFFGRSKRYALYAEDGVVKVLHAEENPGVCETSGGEAMLEAI